MLDEDVVVLGSSQMQDLREGQHWSGQGILEGLCVDTRRFGGPHESKPPEEAFTNLLANFEAQELPSSLHQSSSLTHFRRQRKSCRPLRIPPTFETALPLRDDSKGGLGEGDASIKQRPPSSLKTHKNGSSFGSGERRKLEPLSPTLKEAPHTEKLLQNGKKDHCPPLPTNVKFGGVITHQENGLNFPHRSTRCPLSNNKDSNGAMTCGTKGVKSLPYFQAHGMSLDSLCSTVCRNGACQAKISSDDSFCRRCSCCICKLFDNKRDPSLWILCDPNVYGGCGLSCHIECALKQQVAGVVIDTDGSIPSFDGSYYCQSCHAVRPLIGCWREQLRAAKGSLTLDNLHYRLFLSYRLLKGTKLYKDVHAPIEEAMKRVDAEVSQLASGSVMRPQCSVEVLSCKIDVHRLIDLALEKAGRWSLASREAPKQAGGQSMVPFMVCFEDVSSSSIVVAVNVRGTIVKPKLLGYKLWHRKAGEEPAYACTPTSILYNIDDKCVVSNLHPLTDYTFRVVPFSMEGDIAVCEAGCSTKGTELVEPPVDVYASLGVLLINTERVGGGTTRCVNLDYHHHINNGKDGLKIQDLEEVLVDQHEQGHHLSSNTGKEHKDNCKSFEGSVSVYSKRAAASLQDERREYLGQRNVAGVQEERNLHSLDAPLGPSNCKQVQIGMESSNMGMSSYSAFDCCDNLSRKCLKTSVEQDLLSDTKQCYHTASLNRLCSSNGDLPLQNWGRQGDGRDNGSITTNTHAEMELDHRSDNHKQGVFTCKSEADFHNYEFSVKVIRWLECKGHLKEEFRMKFLTWFTLRASEQEKRVITVFIDTLQDDPASLAGQLVDAFEEMIGVGGRCPNGSDGFCRRLW